MSTTPSTNYTAFQIICDAMWDACKLPRGEMPDSEDAAAYFRKLNNFITFAQTRGIKLWLLNDTAITLVANQSKYTLGPTGNVSMTKPLQVYDQYYLYSTANGGNKRPVGRYSRVDWDALSTTSETGPVTGIFVDPQQSSLNVNTWLTPDANEATGTLHLVLKQQVTNFVGITDTMNFPIEWALYLEWNLAQEICVGQPVEVQTKCTQMAAFYTEALEEFDTEVETSMILQPDPRIGGPRRLSR